MHPEFSVVLPTRGRAPFLDEALASVLRVTASIEVLVVHDRCCGEPALDAARVADPRVRLLAPDAPGGASAARNAGLAAARGRLVAFLDDDDVWLDGHLEASAAALERQPEALMVGSNGYLVAGAALPAHLERLPRVLPERPAGPVPLRDLLLRNWFLTSTVVLRRERLAADERFDAGLGHMEDWDLWLRLARRHPPLHDPRAGALIRRHAGNASGDRRRMAEGALAVLERSARREGGGGPLSADELRAREGRLWHDLAYACLVEEDVAGARRAARESIRRLPLVAKNWVYWVACRLPRTLRRTLVARGGGARWRP